jgi:predicted PurR-regulated permease PerM
LMKHVRSSMIGTGFTLLVIILAILVLSRFLVPLIWSVIFCVATWPLYRRLETALGGHNFMASLLMSGAMALLLALPAAVALEQAINEAPTAAHFLAQADANGIATPEVLRQIPFVGNATWKWWQSTLAQPKGLSQLFSNNAFTNFHSAADVLRRFGAKLIHRLIDFGFSILCLFFMYKNGHVLQRQVQQVGTYLLGAARWDRYFSAVPGALRATVNGLVLVGLGEGVLIALGYYAAGLPSATLWGAATGVLAIVPFGAPIVYLAAAGVLFAMGNQSGALIIVAWGSIVLFIADHFVRPKLIGDSTRLPFLAVLFGILGGVELFGLVGLFLGPVVMVLAVTLWREAVASSVSLP